MNKIDFSSFKRDERNSSKMRTRIAQKDNNIINNLKQNNSFISEKKINILMRCTYRPTTFEKAIQSILLQQYKNFHVYICYDDSDCLQYLKKYSTHPNITITASPNVPRNSKFFYNLYCNFLLEFVKDGWFIFLDDDDVLMSPITLTYISNTIKNDNDIIFWKVKIGNYIVYPKNLSKLTLGAVSGIGFCINHKYKFLGKWTDKSGSDYSYITQINNSNINFNRKMIGEVLTGTISLAQGNLGKKEEKPTINNKITIKPTINNKFTIIDDTKNTKWKSLLPSIVINNYPYNTSKSKVYQKNLHTNVGNINNTIAGKKKIIYYIFEPYYHHIKTIYEYDMSFEKYSKYKVIYISKHAINDIKKIPENSIIFLAYSIIHDIAINVSPQHRELIITLKHKNCYKIANIQDEYYHVEEIISILNEINISHILTVLDTDENIKKIYNRINNFNVKFTKCITGYISSKLDYYRKKISEKSIDVFYRGKKLHPLYGNLGYLKWQIGEVFSIIPGLKINISSNNADRINGDSWYEILSDSKVTLATPSGSNVINLNNYYLNKITKAIGGTGAHTINDTDNITEYYNKAYAIETPTEILDLQVVSPKMFEAIAVGTVLVMYEGRYNNILEPNVHYIELKTDHSNIDDVVSKIKDDNFLQNMADRAYNDIVASDLYSYEAFIEAFDRSLV